MDGINAEELLKPRTFSNGEAGTSCILHWSFSKGSLWSGKSEAWKVASTCKSIFHKGCMTGLQSVCEHFYFCCCASLFIALDPRFPSCQSSSLSTDLNKLLHVALLQRYDVRKLTLPSEFISLEQQIPPQFGMPPQQAIAQPRPCMQVILKELKPLCDPLMDRSEVWLVGWRPSDARRIRMYSLEALKSSTIYQ